MSCTCIGKEAPDVSRRGFGMITWSVANSNTMLVGIFNFDIVVANSVVAVDGTSSFRKCLKQSAIPLLQSTGCCGICLCSASSPSKEERL